MQPRFHILTLLTIAIGLLGSAAVQAGAKEDFEQFVRNDKAQRLMLTIAALNAAMRSAAENPMDQWRRENVRSAVSMLPAAIVALGMEYKAVNLNPYAFPMVQKMLGGFVDVNAPDNYKKFLVSPDKRNIPQLGANFPQHILQQGESQAAAMAATSKGGAVEGGAAVGPIGKVTAEAAPQSPEIASLSTINTAPESKGSSKAERLGYDDGMKKDASRVEVTAAEGTPSADGTGARPGVSAELLQEATREISSIEAQIPKPSTLTILSARRSERSKDEVEFFQAKTKPEGKRVKPGRARAAENYRMPVKPKYWNYTTLIRLAEPGLLAKLRAEGGGQGSEEEQQQGAQVGQILFGIAAIIAAIAPMVVASTQAKADIKIAEINAETQKTLTTITANTSKYLADQQKDIALQQSAIAQQISRENNQGVTQRLDMQLAELRNARDDARQAEDERRQMENQYNQQRIQLAQKQADDNMKLAKATLNAQLTQAGLSQGFTNSTNSGDRLGVERTGSGGSTGTSLGSALAAGGGSASGTGLAMTSTTPRAIAAESASAAPTGQGTMQTAAVTPAAASGILSTGTSTSKATTVAATTGAAPRTGATQLLRAVKGRAAVGDDDDLFDDEVDPITGKPKKARGPRVAATTGNGPRAARGMKGRGMVAGLAAGSARGAFNRYLDRNGGANDDSFVDYREQDTASRAIRAVTAYPTQAPASARPATGPAYNAPASDPEGHSGATIDLSAVLGGAMGGQ